MLKLNYKNCIKKFIVFCLLSAFLTGCSQNKKEGASPIINEDKKQTDSQRQIANEKQAEQERKNKKLSEMYDWDSAKILTDWYYPSFGEGQILQNQDYIFYPEEGTKIVRISKSDGSKKIICEFDFTKGKGIHYCLADDGLFVEYASNIYFCDFDGVNRYKIISHKNLKERITKIKKQKFISRVDTLYFYKNNLYFTTISSHIWKLDLATKKITKMAEYARNCCFCGNLLYYCTWDAKIYKTDINTGKTILFLGGKKKSYYDVMELDGNIYYLRFQDGKKIAVYMYSKGKKKKIYEFNRTGSCGTEARDGKIIITYNSNSDGFFKDGLWKAIIYDVKSSAVSKIENKLLAHVAYITGDMIFCGSGPLAHEGYFSYITY